MFYEDSEKYESRAIVVLTPSESKRFIARAVAKMPEVVKAKKDGIVVTICGSTNAYVAQEVCGVEKDKYWFAVGRITDGELGSHEEDKRDKPVVMRQGKVVEETFLDALKDFGKDDCYIKGANAVDPKGRAGVLMASDIGGTIGAAVGIINARGSKLIIPVGLEKLIPDVEEASVKMGQKTFDYAMGDKVGFMPIYNALVVTELTAIDILFNGEVLATHVASGGIGGSEGSVVISIEGSKKSVKEAFEYISSIKGEPNIGLS